MADRYWVGGSGYWDATTGTKWSTTSGGAGGASVPTTSDNVFFDANSGSGTVTIQTAAANCLNLDCQNFAGTINFTSGVTLTIAGTLFRLRSSAGGWNGATNSAIQMTNVGGSVSIDTQGKSLGQLTLTGAGTTWTLASNLTVLPLGAFTLTSGHFDANDFNVSVGIFSSNNSNTRTISMGNGTWRLTRDIGGATLWTNATQTNLTFNREGSTIEVAPAGSVDNNRTLNFGTLTVNSLTIEDVTFDRTAITLTVNGVNGTLTIGKGNFITVASALSVTALVVNSTRSAQVVFFGGTTAARTLALTSNTTVRHVILISMAVTGATLLAEHSIKLGMGGTGITTTPPGAKANFQLGI